MDDRRAELAGSRRAGRRRYRAVVGLSRLRRRDTPPAARQAPLVVGGEPRAQGQSVGLRVRQRGFDALGRVVAAEHGADGLGRGRAADVVELPQGRQGPALDEVLEPIGGRDQGQAIPPPLAEPAERDATRLTVAVAAGATVGIGRIDGDDEKRATRSVKALVVPHLPGHDAVCLTGLDASPSGPGRALQSLHRLTPGGRPDGRPAARPSATDVVDVSMSSKVPAAGVSPPLLNFSAIAVLPAHRHFTHVSGALSAALGVGLRPRRKGTQPGENPAGSHRAAARLRFRRAIFGLVGGAFGSSVRPGLGLPGSGDPRRAVDCVAPHIRWVKLPESVLLFSVPSRYVSATNGLPVGGRVHPRVPQHRMPTLRGRFSHPSSESGCGSSDTGGVGSPADCQVRRRLCGGAEE